MISLSINKRTDKIMIRENLESVRKRVETACEKAGRSRNEVTLIAVSKTKPLDMLR